MDKLPIGVIGTGHMGQNHMRNLSGDPHFDLVGICDADPVRAAEAAAKYSTAAIPSTEELLSRVKAVVVAVPSSLHKEVGLRVAEHGVHALIEKPLATNSADARMLTDAFASRGLKLAVGHIERFNPVVRELEKLLDNEQVFYLEAQRFGPFEGSGRISDVSVVEDLMIHDVDLICHLMEPHRVKAIRGWGEKVRSGRIDFATCVLRFDANAHAVIHASRVSQDKERCLCIHTAESTIRADLLQRTLTVSKSTGLLSGGAHDTTYRQDGVVQKIFVPIREPLITELLDFYEAVVQDRPAGVGGEAGTRAVEICEQVHNCALKNNGGNG